MGLKPDEIRSMTPGELRRMWKAYYRRQADTMDAVATSIFWIRSMLDSKVELEHVRKSLGWTREE